LKILVSFLAILLLILTAHLGAPVCAQDTPPTFEVASVKANKSGTLQANVGMPPNGVSYVNLPLRGIIQLTYVINQPSKVIGLPDWAATERFDITARAAGAINAEQRRLMMQGLLADRFKLIAHLEKREVSVLALLPLRSDGKLGPKLTETKGCVDPRDAAAKRADNPNADLVVCGPQRGGDGRLVLIGTTMQQFTSLLAIILGRTVAEKSGLAGRYDFELTFSPERPLPNAGGDAPEPAVNLNAPSIYTAVREQLGLKLETQKDMEEVLVVSHVERPSEN